MRRILLVNPWIHDFAAFDFWLKPVGLLRIAAALREAGAEAVLLDLLDRNHPWLENRTTTDLWGRGKFFTAEIDKPDAVDFVPRRFRRYGLPLEVVTEKFADLPSVDAVLITSSMTYWYTGVEETIAVIKKRFPGIQTILGGVYATLMPDHAQEHSGADIILTGSYEGWRNELANILDVKLPATLTPPAWNLYGRLDYAVICFSRGCPWRCTYCASHRLDPAFIPRDVKDIEAEIVKILELGIKRIAFYDDALLYHPRFDKLLEMLIDMDAGFELHTPNGLHVARITPARAELMKGAGFKTLYLSLETVNEELLSRTGAKLSFDNFSKAVNYLRAAGFGEELHAYVLFGLPRQSEDSVKKTLDAALSSNVTPHLTEFSPVPGTIEFKRAGLTDETDPLLTNNTAYLFRQGLGKSRERLKDYLKAHG